MSTRKMKIIDIKDKVAMSGAIVKVIVCSDDQLTQSMAFYQKGMNHPSMIGKMVNVRYNKKFIRIGGKYGLITPVIISLCKEEK